jgi:hypothetical protein
MKRGIHVVILPKPLNTTFMKHQPRMTKADREALRTMGRAFTLAFVICLLLTVGKYIEVHQ